MGNKCDRIVRDLLMLGTQARIKDTNILEG